MAKVLFLERDVNFTSKVSLRDAAGAPITGETCIGFLSATRANPSPIHQDLDNLAHPETPVASGDYVGIFTGANITARLINASPTSYTNKRVYLIRKVGTKFLRPVACRVRDGRLM